ncbi:hypothetical protein AK830_g8763 [Neonectria ditissima]|uniref:Protein NO VEIN C-terminal domain-containing protein n=1 Tax=Neonectria ditissima TaxID=78410 RepID=A0A0P7ATA7_9HYPO|nr:hypothetical protein AK830_g8763 [Neonectria ditissima]
MASPSPPPGPAQLPNRELVREIAKQRGYLGEDKLSMIGAIAPELRREVEEALLRKDEMIGSAVLTLARNLYTSNARFVFELLQNADDNDYSKAVAAGQDPYVSFEIWPDKLSIECNENGFTPDNLQAICAIGKSSKVGAQGYIGEKGIGFKSVFMAAWKVHIQSNGFSFSFTHRKGDSGLGMVTPVWEETDEVLGDCLTRITLFLHDSGDADTNARQLDIIKQQFRELQDTILLFLRKLRKVKVSFHTDDAVDDDTTYSLHGTNPATIQKTTSAGQVDKKYHITKYMAENIPRSENRNYSDDGKRADSTAEVVLAFPLTDTSEPIVDDQDVFAFLPMRPMGFKFLIQTDFVTEASRQGIVTTSLRNQALLDGIAECFVKAAKEFSLHPTLRFQWMRWLPQPKSYPWDGFWTSLLDKIHEKIKPVPLVRTWSNGTLQTISHLGPLQPWALDQHGEPLFRDGSPESYLSKNYEAADTSLLVPYGMQSLSYEEILYLVQLDLKNHGGPSRMKNPETDEDWHSRAAQALLLARGDAHYSHEEDPVRSLNLVPLTNGNWGSAKQDTMYYAHCAGNIQVPAGLGFNLVKPEAAANPQRRALFDTLGVQEISVKGARGLILANVKAQRSCALQTSIEYLRFLYLTEWLMDDVPSKLDRFRIYDQRVKEYRPSRREVYLPTTDEYGPSELLKSKELGDTGFDAAFLHEGYLQDEPPTPEGFALSWGDWLEARISLRRSLQIAQIKDGRMGVSAAFRYIEANRPEKLLGALQHHWALEEATIIGSPELLDELCAMEVPCKGNDFYPISEVLATTYLPLPELERKAARYTEGEKFMFLDLGEDVTSGSYQPKWGFLVDHLCVGDQDDFEFYLNILKTIRYNNTAPSVSRSSRILDLYETIYSRCRESEDPLAAQAVREAFENDHLVFTPGTGSRPAVWAAPNKCLWDALENVQTAYPLEHLYRTGFGRSQEDLEVLGQFFKATLKTPDCSWKTYLNELRHLKLTGNEDFDWIYKLYSCLETTSLGLSEQDDEQLRNAFLKERLVYASFGNSSGWYSIAQCLWSSATQIQGRIPLNDLYPDLETFFVGSLGVQELTIQMAYEELREMGTREPAPSVAKVKETIWAFNSLLDSEGFFNGAQDIVSGRIFPVRYPDGSVMLQTSRTQFAIADRKALREIFRPRAKLLDFSLDEVRRLKPFLEWLDIESRYLSAMVREISTVSGGRMDRLRYPDREIRQKAHAFFRVAVHFNSPRAADHSLALYKVLLGTEVYETDGISSELHLSQDGHDMVHSQNQSELHLRESGNVLKVYVPHDPKEQGFCYFSTLPRRFLEWMMTNPGTLFTKDAGSRAAHVVTSILNAPMINVAQILEAEGIIDVEVPEESEINLDDPEGYTAPVENGVTGEDSVSHHFAEGISRSRSDPMLRSTSNAVVLAHHGGPPSPDYAFYDDGSDWTPPAPGSNTGSKNPSQPLFLFGTPPQAPSFSSVHSSPATTPEPVANHDPAYLELIGDVIAAAAKVSFPAKGSPDISTLFGGLSMAPNEVESSRRFGSRSPQERDMKVGALGELFVFELLSNLAPSLPGFGRHNWQSTMRKFVTAHSKYSDMPPWIGKETSDIVYHDTDRVLTELLVEKGHLQREAWLKKTPRYFIEVKCTTGKCETPFYISKAQYQKMKDYANAASSPLVSPTVYLVARVFNMNKSTVDVRMYMNPEKLRQESELAFTAEAWTVVPQRKFWNPIR